MEVMVWLCFSLLLCFLVECHGQTQFIYMNEYEAVLRCEGNKWKISTKSDNKIDPNHLVQCDSIKVELDDEDELEFCRNKQSKCELEVKSGFVACVKSLDSGILFPFKPSPNVIYSYIFTIPNPHITSTPEKTSSLKVTEGESVSLNCSFNFTQKYNGVPFVVYWIKTVGQSSTCMYSYDYSKHRSLQYGHHCTVQKELLNRLSNQTEEPNSHNIRISEVMESDSGQYLCAVQVHPNNKNTARKGNWKVIQNITVSVQKDKRPQPTMTTVTQKTTEEGTKKTTQKTTRTTTKKTTEKTTKKTTQKTTKKTTEENIDDDRLKPLYVAVPIILCLLLIVVVLFIRKKCITSQGCQTVQQREEAPNMDCSPYAVGNGEEGNFFGSKTADPGREESTPSIDPYSVVRLNSLYESGASDHNKHI